MLFGSAASGRLGPDSDLDIGVRLAAGRDLSLMEHAGLAGDLGRILGRDVDLVLLDRTSPLLRFEAARGRSLYEARIGSPTATAAWIHRSSTKRLRRASARSSDS